MTRTIKELLAEGQEQLQLAHVENARLAAEIILRTLLSLRRIDLFLEPEREVATADELEFLQKIKRKIAREPLQYVVGETEWFGLRIKCDPRALIPRPETEVVVERALALIADVPNPIVVDVGTGTGCIAIAVAAMRQDGRLIATDISAEALSLARENVAMHNLNDRIELRQGESLLPLDGEKKCDLIISNPPYIRSSEYPGLMPEVKDYEPREALLAGEDGLGVIRSIIEQVPAYLKPQGLIVLEFCIDHLEPLRDLIAIDNLFDIVEVIIDYNGRERGIALRLKATN